MKHSYLLLTTLFIFILSACHPDPTFSIIKFDNSKTTATDITRNSVTLSCTISEVETGNNYLGCEVHLVIADYPGFFQGAKDNNKWSDGRKISTGCVPGTFSAKFDKLTPSTTYYYAPCVVASGGNYILQGEVKSFTTKEFRQEDLILNDFLGMYEMSYYDGDSRSYKTISNVEILIFEGKHVCVAGFPTINGLRFWAYGVWDDSNKNILLSDKYYHTGHNVWTNILNTQYVDIFTPCYYNKNTNDFKTTFTKDGHPYICLSMVSEGNISMTSPKDASSDGVYSNAFCWARYYSPSWQFYSYECRITDVTLTKTSSN